MIDPREVQEIVKRTILTCGDMLVGTARTYELSCGHLDEERYKQFIKEDICTQMSRHLVGKSIVEHTKDPLDRADIYTGRVLVVPYLELETAIAKITSKIIEELNSGNNLVLPN